jgi:hypothetical protein
MGKTSSSLIEFVNFLYQILVNALSIYQKPITTLLAEV